MARSRVFGSPHSSASFLGDTCFKMCFKMCSQIVGGTLPGRRLSSALFLGYTGSQIAGQARGSMTHIVGTWYVYDVIACYVYFICMIYSII